MSKINIYFCKTCTLEYKYFTLYSYDIQVIRKYYELNYTVIICIVFRSYKCTDIFLRLLDKAYDMVFGYSGKTSMKKINICSFKFFII